MKINLKLLVISFAIITFSSIINLNAQITFTNEEGLEYTSDTVLCQNRDYEFETNSTDSEIVLLDPDTNYILEAHPNYDGTFNIIVPSNTESVTIMQRDLVDDIAVNSTETRELVNFEDCNYSVLKDEYSIDAPTSTFSYDGNSFTITPSLTSEDDYVFYQFLGSENGEKLDETTTIDVSENELIQYTETINGTTKYYEIYLNPDMSTYTIKSVSDFEEKTLQIQIVNIEYIYLSIALLVLFLIFHFLHRKYKKKYNIMKNQKRKSEKKRRGQ